MNGGGCDHLRGVVCEEDEDGVVGIADAWESRLASYFVDDFVYMLSRRYHASGGGNQWRFFCSDSLRIGVVEMAVAWRLHERVVAVCGRKLNISLLLYPYVVHIACTNLLSHIIL